MRKNKHNILITIFFLVTLVWSCKKNEKAPLQIETILIEEGSYLRSVFFISDSVGFASGGKRDIEGYIFKTSDGGDTWTKTIMSKPRCIYDIYFINDSVGFAGGDFLYLLTTTNGGADWSHFPYKNNELPFHEQNRPAIKKFDFSSPNNGYFVGGEDYKKGVIYQTSDGGTSWSFDTLYQEMNYVNTYSNNSWAAGFGYIGRAVAGEKFEQLSITNDVFTSILELNDLSIITISNTGGIYKSNDQGENWSTIQKKKGPFSKRIAYNGMSFIDNKGFIISDNSILISEDFGENWKEIDYESSDKLTSITTLNNTFYVTTESGTILKFN